MNIEDTTLSEVGENIRYGAVQYTALAMPAWVLQMSSLVDNPWAVCARRAKRAGKELARALHSRAHGERPVVLVGWGLGGRVVFACLEELSRLAKEAHERQSPQEAQRCRGVVEGAFLIGAAASGNPARWRAVLPLVSGRLVNAFCTEDWLLPIVHRGCTGGVKSMKRIAGNAPILCEGVENVDITPINDAHFAYRYNLAKIMEMLRIHSSVQLFDGNIVPIIPYDKAEI
jgi:pimeloyl-ACP methyl ester carboxylesterase